MLLKSRQIESPTRPLLVWRCKDCRLNSVQRPNSPITVANRGLGPLRKITVAIPELEGQAQFALLRAEESRTIAFGFVPTVPEANRFMWFGERSASMAFLSTGAKRFRLKLDLRKSPPKTTCSASTRTSRPLRSIVSGRFFGRENIIDQVVRLLRFDGPSTVILLEGNRSAGKTFDTEAPPEIRTARTLGAFVYCQFQGVSGEPNAESSTIVSLHGSFCEASPQHPVVWSRRNFVKSCKKPPGQENHPLPKAGSFDR